MSFPESSRDFDYAQAAAEIGVDASSAHCWSDLEKAAFQDDDLDRLQAVHDVSWILTQCDPERRAKLQAIREAVKQSLEGAYGPSVWNFAETVGVTLEGLILPSAKSEAAPARGTGSALDYFLRKRADVPSPVFAAVFAKCWLQRLAVEQLPERAVSGDQRQRRTLLGFVDGCDQCDGGLHRAEFDRRVDVARNAARQHARRAGTRGQATPPPELLTRRLLGFIGDAAGLLAQPIKCQVALNAPLPHQPAKTVRDLLQAMNDDGGLPCADMADLLGEEVLCRTCSRWIVLPENARSGWVWPLLDGRGEVCTWVKLRFGE